MFLSLHVCGLQSMVKSEFSQDDHTIRIFAAAAKSDVFKSSSDITIVFETLESLDEGNFLATHDTPRNVQ